MRNKVSVLVTLSNFILIVVLGFFWWHDRQQKNGPEWEPTVDVVKEATLTCGNRLVVYTNTCAKMEKLDFALLNNCNAPVGTWVGTGDSVIKPGSSITVNAGQKVKSAYELMPGESFIAQSPTARDSTGQAGDISFHIIARKVIMP